MNSGRILATALTASVMIAVGIGYCIHRTVTANLEQWQLHHISESAMADSQQLERRIEQLTDSLKTLQIHTQSRSGIAPTLQQIEELAWQHNLDTRRIERVMLTGRDKLTSNPSYNVSVVGSVFEAVPFLHELENQFQLRLSQATLLRTNLPGQTVILSLSIEVAAQ
jgi:hypothetical protein